MKTTKRITLAVAVAVAISPALAMEGHRQSVDYSALYGDPTWPPTAKRAPGVVLPSSGERESFLRQDPMWPATPVVTPAIRLDTYRAPRPAGSIDNDGEWAADRPFAPLDAAPAEVGSSRP